MFKLDGYPRLVSKGLIIATGAAGVLLLLLVLARPLGCMSTHMSVAEYARHDREGSMRSFVVVGKVVGQHATGDHAARAGNTIVYFSGGLKLTTPDGRALHELRIEGPAGEKGTLYFDPGEVSAPAGGATIEVRGQFETIQVMRQRGPPGELCFGLVRSIKIVTPSTR